MRFGIREICNVVFKPLTDVTIGNQTFKKNQPVLYLDTAKTSTLEGAATTVYAQGGRGNPRLIAWEGERTLTFTVEDALISTTSLAMLIGAGATNVKNATNDDTIQVHHTFDLPILKDGKVKIDSDLVVYDQVEDIYVSDDAPIFGMILDNAGAGVVPCTLSGSGENGDGISGIVPTLVDPENRPDQRVYHIADRQSLVLDFGDQAAGYVGKIMRVDCYIQKKQMATEITIDAEHFAGNYYVEADTLFREQATAKDMPAIIVLPNVKIQSNFTFSMANSGDPSTFTFTMDAFPGYTKFDHTKKVLAAIQIIADENIHEEPVAEVEPGYGVLDPAFAYVKVAADGTETVLPGVVAGYDKEWAQDQFPEDPKGVKFSRLGSYLKAAVNRTDVEFTGNLNRVDSWEAFSSNPADLTGYYFPFTMYAPAGTILRRTNASGETKDLVFGETGDAQKDQKDNVGMTFIYAVHPDAPIALFKLVDGTDSDKVTNYTFDFSRVVFK